MHIGPTRGPFVIKPGGEPAKKSEYESNTSLQKFLECPVLYHDWYARKFREPASKELVFGRVYHGTLEDALVEKMVNRVNIHPAALQERWHQRWLMELHFTGQDWEWKAEAEAHQSPEDWFKMGSDLVQLWRQDYLPALKPKHVEESFWLPLTGVKRAIYGKIDLITDDGLLIDHKTSSVVWKEYTTAPWYRPREVDLQMCIYHAAYESLVKDWPKSCELHRAITSGIEIERIKLDYSGEEVQKMFDTVIKPAIREIDDMWIAGTFECRCKKHTKVPATAARPLADAEGYAAGTTEGPVPTTPRRVMTPKEKYDEAVQNFVDNRTPPPPVNVDEVPF